MSAKTIDNGHFVKVLMDYAAILFTQASSLASSMIHMSELLSILRDLKEPLKQAFQYVKNRISADVELHNVFQKLMVALQVVEEEILQKVKWKNSIDLLALDASMAPHIKQLEHEVSSLIFFLKRIGMYTPSAHTTAMNNSIMYHSSWALSRPTSEHNPSEGSLWPLLFLPDRSMSYLPREELMLKTIAMMQPAKKPTHVCVVNKGGYGGLGRTQLILEAAYQSIEKGSFGVIFWLSCLTEASLITSYRKIARKISKIDPNFSDSLESVIGENNFHHCTNDLLSSDSTLHVPFSANAYKQHEILISLVVSWLSKVPMPYLLVYDNADDPSFISSKMFPLIGQGSIVLITGFSHISRWTTLLQTRPKAVELTTLSFAEGIHMSECGLDTSTYHQTDKEKIIELLKYFHHSPAEFCNAILTINCMRNSAFVNIGPKEYLSRVQSDTSGPAGLIVKPSSSLIHNNNLNHNHKTVTTTTSSTSNDMLHRIDVSYRSVLMRLYTAQDVEHASATTLKRLLDLFAYISPENVSTKLLYLWLSPEHIYSPMLISVKLNRPSGLAFVPRGKDAESPSTELSVDIRSFLPRMLQSSGDLFYDWTILRSYTDLKQFFDTLQPHCSSCIPKDILPDHSHPKDGFSLHKIVKSLNTAFTALCQDPLWPTLCDQKMVKKFLNIHANDCCHASQTNKLARILDPLVAVGLVHLEHRSPEAFQSKDIKEEEGREHKGGDKDENRLSDMESPDDLLVGINSSVQDTLVYMLDQENRAKVVSAQVLTFLLDAFKAASLREGGHPYLQAKGYQQTTENVVEDECKTSDNNLTRQYLLPHVIKVIYIQQVSAERCIVLCQFAYSFAKAEELYHSAELIARRTLYLYKETNGTTSSTFLLVTGKEDFVKQRQFEFEAIAVWQYNLAFCIFKQNRYSESEMHFKQALKARHAVTETPDSDIHVADIERDLGDNSFYLHAYNEAILHYESALQIYMHLQKEKTVLDMGVIQNNIAHIYEHLTRVNAHGNQFPVAMQYNDKVYECMLLESTQASTISDCVSPSLDIEDKREKALFCVHRKARMFMALSDFEAAKGLFLATLKDIDEIYSTPMLKDGSINTQYRFPFSQLRNKVSVLCNLSECYMGLAQYTDAKQSLFDAEHLFEVYATYHKESKIKNELSEFKQNRKATSKLKISVYECIIDLSVELYELESAVPYTEKAQAVCIDLYGANHHKTSLMSCKAGNLLKSLGRFNDATQLFKKVLSITDQSIRLDGAVVALNSLADMAATQADFISAEQYLQDALKILQYKYKSEQGSDPSVAEQFILLAELKKSQHLFENAKECYESALKIQRKCYGSVHITVAHTLDYLADLFSERGETRGAQKYRDQSSTIYDELRQQEVVKGTLKSDSADSGHMNMNRVRSTSSADATNALHGHTHAQGHVSAQMSVSALHSMASLLSSVANDHTTSPSDVDTIVEPLHTRAVRILTSQYGKNHPRVAMALNNLAKVLSKKGKKHEAQAMLETALIILRKVHGENHPHVAAAVHNLGILLGERGQYEDAIKHVLSALTIRRQVAAGNSLLLSESLRTLGFLYYQVGNIPLSREALEECLLLRRQLFEGVENQYPIAVSLNNLGVVLKTLMMHTQAEECLRESLLIRLNLHGDATVDINDDIENKDNNYHPVIAFAWHTLGALLVSMAKYREARVYLEHALAARKLSYGDIHADVANTLHSLADLCLCERRFGEAASLLHTVVDVRVSLYGETHPLVLATMRKLWLLSLDPITEQTQTQIDTRQRGHRQQEKTLQHTGKILFGSEQETEVFSRIKARIYRMDSNQGENNEEEGEGAGRDSVLCRREHTVSTDNGSTSVMPIDNDINTDYSTATKLSAATAHMALLDLVMNAFEEDQESTAAAQFLKFEAVRKAQIELNRLTQSQNSSQYSNIEGGDGWPERLMQKMIFDKSSLTSELREQEADMIEKRSTYGQHEAVLLKLRAELALLQSSLHALEVKVQTDKRVKYELEACQKDEKKKLAALKAKETDRDMANLLFEIQGLDETITLREKKLKELTYELSYLEETNTLYLQSKSAVSKVEADICAIVKQIEDARWQLVHMRSREESAEFQGGKVSEKIVSCETNSNISSNGESGIRTKSDVHTAVMNDVAESNLKAEIGELIRSKVEVDILREMEEVKFQRITNKLETLRKKYKISGKSQADMLKAMASSQQSSAGRHKFSSSDGGEGSSGDSDTDGNNGDDDDDGDDSEADSDTEEGQAKAETRRTATKKMKKKLKKQKMLIDLLRNQIINLGHKPIAEIVTYQRAESNLQDALSRLMDGDETASDDFDKWDEFVRNHPEYKAKQLRIKERFKQENLAVNKAALRLFRTLVPPGIVSTCTLVTLEESLPKAVAKRIWMTKALHLTRISADRIARLHAADLQSKYSPQGLDELELRAIYAALPEKFDNDAKGDKAAWCEAILQSIQGKCKALPWSKGEGDEGGDVVEPSEADIQSYFEGVSRHITYRNYLTPGPYDPDEEAEVMEEAVSSKDELTSQQEMLKVMGSLHGVNTTATGDTSNVTSATSLLPRAEEGPPLPASSIRRRASMFGASKNVSSTRSMDGGGDKKRAGGGGGGPPKLDFFGELKLKAEKKKQREKEKEEEEKGGGIVSTGGGMAGFLNELQNAAKKKQFRRGSSAV